MPMGQLAMPPKIPPMTPTPTAQTAMGQAMPGSPAFNPYATPQSGAPTAAPVGAWGVAVQESPSAVAAILEPVVLGWDTEAEPVPDAAFWTTINANDVKDAGGDGTTPGYQVPA